MHTDTINTIILKKNTSRECKIIRNNSTNYTFVFKILRLCTTRAHQNDNIVNIIHVQFVQTSKLNVIFLFKKKKKFGLHFFFFIFFN